MQAFTFPKLTSTTPSNNQAYLSLQPDFDPDLDLATMQRDFATLYQAASVKMDTKRLQYYMSVLTNFALATTYAKQDAPKKKKQSPASRFSQWVRKTVSRKKTVDSSEVETSLAAHPPHPDTSVPSAPMDASSLGDVEKPKQRKKSFSRALTRLGKKMSKVVKKNRRGSEKPDGILSRVSEDALLDLDNGIDTAGGGNLKHANEAQDDLPLQGQAQVQRTGTFVDGKYVPRFKLSPISEHTEPSTGPSSLSNVDRVVLSQANAANMSKSPIMFTKTTTPTFGNDSVLSLRDSDEVHWDRILFSELEQQHNNFCYGGDDEGSEPRLSEPESSEDSSPMENIDSIWNEKVLILRPENIMELSISDWNDNPLSLEHENGQEPNTNSSETGRHEEPLLDDSENEEYENHEWNVQTLMFETESVGEPHFMPSETSWNESLSFVPEEANYMRDKIVNDDNFPQSSLTQRGGHLADIWNSPAGKGKEKAVKPSKTDFNLSNEPSVPYLKMGLGRIAASARDSLDLDDFQQYTRSMTSPSFISKWQQSFHEQQKQIDKLEATVKAVAWGFYEMIARNHAFGSFDHDMIYSGKPKGLVDDYGPEPVTHWEDIYDVLAYVFDCADLTADHAIITFIYVERMCEKSRQYLCDVNWHLIILAALLTATKVWDDYAVYNRDFVQIFPGMKLQFVHELERKFLKHIDWDISCKCPEFASTYFDLRAIWATKNGCSSPA